jgi:hypothetical protein
MHRKNLGLVAIALLILVCDLGAEDPKGPNWVNVTDQAAWQARDSQGELVYRDQIWILGGWFDSYQAPPRDVWSSQNGKDWTLVNQVAPWKHSDLGMTVTFKDKMWFLGGWYNGRLPGHEATDDVWSSVDGIDWVQAPASVRWTPRIAAGIVEFKGKMWILGGTENYYFGDEKSLKNDVWFSEDGEKWTLATANAGWSPRAYHSVTTYDGKLWVMGGGNYVPDYQAHNDVWCSEDGITWTEVTKHAPWGARLWFSSVVYRDRMWVLGGWSKNPTAKNLGDVWYSQDGKNWKQLLSDVIWTARHEHSTYVFKDKIFIAGGHAMPLSSEVWSLELPADWFKK